MSNSSDTNSFLPSHVAIVMDGNRRWAESRGLTALQGHKEGFERFKEIGELCFDKGIKYVTFYAFSSENWNRTSDEVGGLMRLMRTAIENELEYYKKRDIRVRIIGDKTKLPQDLEKSIAGIENDTSSKSGSVLNVCISYGGRDEIAFAAAKIAKDGGEITPKSISENIFTAGQPDPEMIIRTGGQHRLSNFLTWQSVYSELYFTDVLWPDFDADELEKSLEFYSKIKRNFGR